MAISQLEKEIGKRLERLLPELKRGKKEFANGLGINESQFSRMIQGISGISVDVILDVSSNYGVAVNWLLTGEGDIFKKETGSTKEPASLSAEDLAKIHISLEALNSIFPKPLARQTSTNGQDDKPFLGKTSLAGLKKVQQHGKAKGTDQKKGK